MPKEEPTKKIIGLRTFADDVKRARGGSVSTPPKPPAQSEPKKKDPETKQVAKASEKTPTQKEEPKPKKRKHGLFGGFRKKNAGEKEVVLEKKDKIKKTATPPPIPTASPTAPIPPEPPMDIPPFHNIRASSPGDTTFTDAKEVHKHSHTKTRKPQKQIQANSLGIDTDSIEAMSSSVLSPSRDAVFDTEEALTDVGQGTIVTDRKRERFKVVPAVGEAVTDWIEDKVDDVEDAYRPKHEIVRSSRRKDVITAAAKDSKLAPSDDYSSLKEKLRTMERITETEDLAIKDESEVPAPTWNHTDDAGSTEREPVSQEQIAKEDEPGTKVIPTPAPDVSQPKVIDAVEEENTAKLGPRVSKETVTAESKTADEVAVTQEGTPVTPAAPETETPTPRFTPSAAPETQAPVPEPVIETAQPEPLPEPEQVPQPAPTPVTATPVIEEQPTFSRTPVPAYRLNRAGEAIPIGPSGTQYLTFAAVAIAAVILGIGSTVWWFSQPSENDSVVIARTEMLVNAQTTAKVPLSTTRTEFYNALTTTAANSAPQLMSLVPTVGEDDAPVDVVMTSLGWSAPTNFIRNVSSISFGFTSAREPFIILKTNSFDTAFGGILAWEPYMTRDLSPLFGSAAEVNVYDTKISNHDIRILTSDGYNDKIVYGFINKNMILITTTREAFSAVAPNIIQ